jgi:hypothetical protein
MHVLLGVGRRDSKRQVSRSQCTDLRRRGSLASLPAAPGDEGFTTLTISPRIGFSCVTARCRQPRSGDGGQQFGLAFDEIGTSSGEIRKVA